MGSNLFLHEVFNILNLPRQIMVDGKTWKYHYDATGSKLRMENSNGTVNTKYAGAFEYNNGNYLTRIATEEGQISTINNGANATDYTFEYYRAATVFVTIWATTGRAGDPVVLNEAGAIVQETEYMPYGLAIPRTAGTNKYLYNGKEKQPETGLLDYGARQYDPTIGRWMVVDPVTEGQLEFSPYHYSFNNPIRFSDPDGRFPDCCKGLGDFVTGVGQALNDDMGWGNPVKANPGHVDSYNDGVTAGHYLSAALGTGEAIYGGTKLVGDAVATVETAGLGAVVTGIAAVKDAAMVAHGFNTVMNAYENLQNDKGKIVKADSHPNSNKTSGNNCAAQTGKQKHKELAEKVNQKPGWKSESSIVGKDGKTYKPDVQTPSGNLLEYKPKTPTGVSKGKTQAKNYENQTGQKTRVIYYEN